VLRFVSNVSECVLFRIERFVSAQKHGLLAVANARNMGRSKRLPSAAPTGAERHTGDTAMTTTTLLLTAAILAQPVMLIGLVIRIAFQGLRLG
jgi:hypothetical protein